jgi:hypothetical protein
MSAGLATAILAPMHEHVEIAVREIGGRQARRDAHVDARVGGLESRQARNQPARGEAGGCPDRQRPVRIGVACPARARVEAVEQCRQILAIERTGGGQDNARRMPLEQGHAEVLLERAHLVAHGGRGDAELVRRHREAEMPRGGLERMDRPEGRQAAVHGG